MERLKYTLVLAFLLSVEFAFSQSNPKERILIRIYEVVYGRNNPEIIVTQQDKSEIIPLKPMDNNTRQENDKKIFTTLNKYLSSGYKIESSSGVDVEVQHVTTYILIKE